MDSLAKNLTSSSLRSDDDKLEMNSVKDGSGMGSRRLRKDNVRIDPCSRAFNISFQIVSPKIRIIINEYSVSLGDWCASLSL